MKKVFSFSASALLISTTIFSKPKIYSQNDDCVNLSLDMIEIHESYFGCLDPDDATNLYALLYSLCENYSD